MLTKALLAEAEGKLILGARSQGSLEQHERTGCVLDGTAVEPSVTKKTEDDDSFNSIQDFLHNNEPVKNIGSKITQWVKSARKTSEDLTSVESAEEEGTNGSLGTKDTAPQKRAAWKKLGKGGLIEKLARLSPGHGRAKLELSSSSSNGLCPFTMGSAASTDEPLVREGD
jgi:hypothetical protein